MKESKRLISFSWLAIIILIPVSIIIEWECYPIIFKDSISTHEEYFIGLILSIIAGLILGMVTAYTHYRDIKKNVIYKIRKNCSRMDKLLWEHPSIRNINNEVYENFLKIKDSVWWCYDEMDGVFRLSDKNKRLYESIMLIAMEVEKTVFRIKKSDFEFEVARERCINEIEKLIRIIEKDFLSKEMRGISDENKLLVKDIRETIGRDDELTMDSNISTYTVRVSKHN